MDSLLTNSSINKQKQNKGSFRQQFKNKTKQTKVRRSCDCTRFDNVSCTLALPGSREYWVVLTVAVYLWFMFILCPVKTWRLLGDLWSLFNFSSCSCCAHESKACGKATIKKALRRGGGGGGLKLHFETSSLHINCYILIWNTTRGIYCKKSYVQDTRHDCCISSLTLPIPKLQRSYQKEASSDWTIWPESGFWLVAMLVFFSPLT